MQSQETGHVESGSAHAQALPSSKVLFLCFSNENYLLWNVCSHVSLGAILLLPIPAVSLGRSFDNFALRGQK